MQTADSLMKIFNCKEDKDLAEVFGRDKSVVSHWRKKGLPPAIEKRALELMKERGIVSEPETPYSPSLNPIRQAINTELERMTPRQLTDVLAYCLDINGEQYEQAKYNSRENRAKRIKGE